MSDETPQKGWDSWFGAPPDDSSEDEQPAPQRSEPETPVPSAAPGALDIPTPRVSPVSTIPPAPPTPPEPPTVPAPAAMETEPEPEPETGLEATNWTVPSLGAVLEGRGPDAQETRVVSSSPDDQRTQIAHHRADAEPTQLVSPKPDAMPTQAITPQAMPTQALPTQALPGRVPPSRPAPSGYAARVPGQSPAAQEDATPAAPPAPAPQTPEPPAVPSAASQPPASLPWQTQQPAQLWGATESAPLPQQAQYSAPQQPFGRPQDQDERDRQNPQVPGQRPPAGPGSSDDEWNGWDDEPERRRPETPAAATGLGDGRPPRSRRKFALMGGVGGAAIVALVAVLVLTQTGGNAKAGAAAKPSGFQPTASTPAGAAQETAAAFLAAWQDGNLTQAAQYTDDPTAALAALTSYKSGLNLDGLQLTTQTATAATPSSTGATPSGAAAAPSGTVSFGVSAKVGLPPGSTASGASSTASPDPGSSAPAANASGTVSSAPVTAAWTYTSKLTAYEKNGGWWVEWNPGLIAPNLTATEKIVSVPVAPSASEVTDASGDDLSSATDPGVRNIAAALKKSAPAGQGTPGIEIELENASGTPIANTSDTLSKPVDTGVVKTTIDPSVEQAAQSAVSAHSDSSMVVIQPTTGDILAVANNDGDNDFALTARVAPGSTNKIVSSTALFTSGLVSSPSQGVQCPEKLPIDGTVFENDQGESTPASTPFLDDFAQSCNDAFAKWYSQIGDSTLAQTAEKYYGLNQQWNIGLGEAGPYYDIPSSASNGELAQELFGQGQLEAAPLAMASVAATVDTGDFKQPIVVPGQAQLSATPLPGTVQQDLQQMMKAVIYQSDGTAYGVFSGVNSTVYGKTGTADVGASQQKPNSWMVVYDPTLNVAVGCVVLDAGYGASFAGPEVAKVLESLQSMQ